jgi:hypothetical protein
MASLEVPPTTPQRIKMKMNPPISVVNNIVDGGNKRIRTNRQQATRE